MTARDSAKVRVLTRAQVRRGALLLLSVCGFYAVYALPLRIDARVEAVPHHAADPEPLTPAITSAMPLPLPRREPARATARPSVDRPAKQQVSVPAPPDAPEEPDPHMTKAAERWRSEPEDAEWTRNQRAMIVAMLDGFGARPDALLDVSCRATVCRVLLDAADIGQLAALGEHVQTEHYPIAFHPQTEDRPQIVAYLPREGLEREVLGIEP